MKKIFFVSALALSFTTFQSCQTADKKSSTLKDSVAGDTTMVNGNHVTGSESTQSGLDESGATFIRKAVVGGMMEIQASEIALKNAKSTAVKNFASKMLEDHTRANDELKALANDKKIILPDALPADDQIHIDTMKKLMGSEFDKHYIAMMVTDHDKTVALFKEGIQNRDATLKTWATNTLATITQHDEMAKKIALDLK